MHVADGVPKQAYNFKAVLAFGVLGSTVVEVPLVATKENSQGSRLGQASDRGAGGHGLEGDFQHLVHLANWTRFPHTPKERAAK
jgi:hypothetical protein